MKVLLMGEFSGLNTNLKNGLLELGVDCTLASIGDGWKKIPGADMPLYTIEDKSMIKKVYNYLVEPYINRSRFYGYDTVQMVYPVLFKTLINKQMFDSIKANNEKLYISIAGGCSPVYESYKDGRLGYYIYDNNPESCLRYTSKKWKYTSILEQEKYGYKNADGLIPIMYEYAVGVRDLPNCEKTIPIPFDASLIRYTPNKVNGKIRILHGIIREKSKGSDIIKEALDIIQKRYPDEVEIIIDGKMPLDKYLELLSSVNILVDQCKEHCYGLNALYAMAEGRIVLGGATHNSLKEYGLTSCPVFHIGPNVDQIVEQLENVISKKNQFEELGYQSRKFVESFHNHITVAQQYIDVWKKINNKE